ncbi:amidohydrolase [Hanstruepera neustonica]|uniref:Omega-amidase YafV n=1 Tax=Hanstruepera neustonica TaxID=1445657 RepID=A0A2K1E401_9FLAO|nr:amidohydrolase [Hanstruepera neustonica]PNQ75016.1 amidohydrolase [Hanstruepera neustonica]
MQDQLKTAFIQTDLVWEDPKANRKNFKAKFDLLPEDVDLVILPEMFSTGFTMNAQAVAESMNGKTVTWMLEKAQKHQFAIVGSLIIEENGHYLNRLVFAFPDGTFNTYDKRHTFSLAGEDKVFTAGTKKVIIGYKGWKICPQICYDLRFPVWARNVEDYDLLLYVANWPKPRIAAWDALLKARAIENMSYCIGVNRIGQDGKENEYCGHSAIYDVLGNNITPLRPNKEQIEMTVLEKKHIVYYRDKLKFLDDKDAFTIV